ncbi:MAG: methylisocitrate lyase [Candidatus Thermoplasmatota archaeon]|jgi:methylisocitrate lyase|nr:methylisocitrate lyase [Candidatus Thermoplasmatota archaeon]
MSVLRDNINSGPSELRKILKNGFCVAPGVFNGVSAILAERSGFNALYLSGSGVAGNMGLPDLSVTTLTEVAEEARRITAVTRLPLIVDVDTGFGETINVIRTVREMEHAGASAIHIEDQVLPKRCGHLNGKKIVPEDDMVLKIKAAVSARKNRDFVIIARTDARSINGMDDAIERSREYLRAGADMIFTEALESRSEFERFASEVKAPLLANMTEFGKSPLLSVEEIKEIGYRAVIFPLTAFRAMLKTVEYVYSDLKKSGTQRDFMERLMTRSEYYDVIGYDEYEKEDRELAGSN